MMSVLSLLPFGENTARFLPLLWSKKKRDKSDLRQVYENLYNKAFLASNDFESLSAGRLDSKKRFICFSIIIFQVFMSLRLWILLLGFKNPLVEKYLGHYYLTSGKHIQPFILSQAMVGSAGTCFRFVLWFFEGKKRTGFMTNFVRDKDCMKNSRIEFLVCFFAVALNPFNVNVFGILFRVFMVVKTLMDNDNTSSLIVLIIWMSLACLQVTFYGWDCSLGAVTSYLACEHLNMKVKKMREILEKLRCYENADTYSRKQDNDSSDASPMIQRLYRIHRSLIQNLLDYDPIQNVMLFFLSVNSIPTLGSLLYNIIYSESHVVFTPTYIMFFFVIFSFTLLVQLKSSHLRYTADKVCLDLHKIQARNVFPSKQPFLSVGDKKMILKIIEDTSCPNRPLGFTAYPDIHVSFAYVFESQLRYLSFFLLICSILRK